MDQPEPLMRIEEFLRLHSKMAKNVFLTRFDHPVFIVNMLGTGKDGKPDSGILRGSKSTVMEGKTKTSSNVITLVVPLEKGDRGDRGDVFTMGRGRDNDIIISNPSVSRKHASIEIDRISWRAVVTDLGSSYGTKVEGLDLEANKPHPLKSGGVVILGQSAYCTFLSPPDFYDYIEVLARARGTSRK